MSEAASAWFLFAHVQKDAERAAILEAEKRQREAEKQRKEEAKRREAEKLREKARLQKEKLERKVSNQMPKSTLINCHPHARAGHVYIKSPSPFCTVPCMG